MSAEFELRREPPRMMPSGRATHILVRESQAVGLRELADGTRVTQAQYLREAVVDLLAKYRVRNPDRWWSMGGAPAGHLVSIVFRLDASLMAGLAELANRTRIRRSELVREAVADLLEKYAARGWVSSLGRKP